MDEDEILDAIAELVAENPRKALVLLTGVFVGVIEHSVKLNGGDPKNEITIDGNRNITLHKDAR